MKTKILTIGLIFVSMFPALADAAIAFDQTAVGANNTSSSPFTESITVGSGDPILFVFLTLNSGGTISSVTYNGVSMTESGTAITESGGGQFQEIWYIYGQSGTHNLVITFSGVSLISTEVSFTGVAQSAPDAHAQNTAASTVSVSLTSTVSGDWAVGMCKSYGSSGSTYALWSVRNADTGGAGMFNVDSNGSIGAAGSYTASCIHSGTNMALTGLLISPFGSGGGGGGGTSTTTPANALGAVFWINLGFVFIAFTEVLLFFLPIYCFVMMWRFFTGINRGKEY